jgi:hypothetical protein
MPYDINARYTETGELDPRPVVFDLYAHTSDPDLAVDDFIAGRLFLAQLDETRIGDVTQDGEVVMAYNLCRALSLEDFFKKARSGYCIRLSARRYNAFIRELKLFVRLNFSPAS